MIGSAVDWWRLVAPDPLTDEEHLNQLLKSGRFSSVELVKLETTPDRKRAKEKFRLTAPHIEKGLATDLAAITREWLAAKRGKLDVPAQFDDDAEGARRLSAVIANGAQNIDFDDGWVLLEDDAGRTNKISPSRIAEVFTYTLSVDDRVSDIEFFRRAWPSGSNWSASGHSCRMA